MPNWCSNSVVFTHTDPTQIKRLAEAASNDSLINEFLPCPPELHEHPAPLRDKELEERFLKEYGATDWYNWQVKNWGTKWDIHEPQVDVVDDQVTVSFQSAWSPPVVFYQAMVDMGWGVTAYYFEPGMAYCGKFEDGDDAEYGIDEATVKWVQANIPEDIDQMMGISDEIAMWEEMEAEDDTEEGVTNV